MEEKYNSLQKIIEEQNRMLAEMREELRASRTEQHASSSVPSSSDIHLTHGSSDTSYMEQDETHS